MENNSLDEGLDAGFQSQRGDGALREQDLGTSITTRGEGERAGVGEWIGALQEVLGAGDVGQVTL